jgi:hypothetical protein
MVEGEVSVNYEDSYNLTFLFLKKEEKSANVGMMK